MALELMRDLARCEGYIGEFRVTKADLIKFGLGQRRRFTAFVAPSKDDKALLGIAVTYQIPWTYDQRPVVVLKELFVAEEARGKGIGEALFQHVLAYGRDRHASGVKWTVLKTNDRAKAFYRRLGGSEEQVWDSWKLPLMPSSATGDEPATLNHNKPN